MKSQAFTVENVLFFSIGIFMVILLYTAFASLNDNIKESVYKISVEKTGEYISYVLTKVYQVGNSTSSNITVFLPLPYRIGDCILRIEEIDNEIMILCPSEGIKHSLNLYGIKPKIKSGYIYTSQMGIKIRYENNEVYIE